MPSPSPTPTPTPCTEPLASGSAFGELVSLDVQPLEGEPWQLTSARSPLVSGSAPPAYSAGGALPTLSVSHPATGTIVQTGAAATSILGGTGEHGTALSQAQVDAVVVRITELSNLLTLQAQTVSSSASIEGSCCSGEGLTASATVDLVGATLDCLIGAGIPLPADPAPNTTVLDRLGIRIVLNEQIVDGDGHGSLSMTVNAVHVHLDETLVRELGGVNGDIIIGQSTAALSCNGGLQLPPCVGDCNRNRVVAVNELIMGVNIALGNMPMEMCTAMDPSGDRRATIDELIQAVYNPRARAGRSSTGRRRPRAERVP